MSTTFRDIWNELMADAPGLDPEAAKKYANRAYLDVCREREWGFLKARGVLECPAQVSTGTVSLTQFQNTFTFNAAAKTAIAAEFGMNPAVTDCQLKAGNVLYQIATYDPGTGSGTFDRVFEETTNAALSYSVFRAYFKPPSTDFARFISIADTVRSKPIFFGPRWTARWLDRIDPQRTNSGEPYCLVPVQSDGSNGPLYEMWPHPTSRQAFPVLYRKKGIDLTNDDELPSTFPVNLVLAKAKYRAYEFKVGDAVEKGMKAVAVSGLIALMKASQGEYAELLKDAKRIDREREMDALATPQFNYGFQYDADWMQSHLGFPY